MAVTALILPQVPFARLRYGQVYHQVGGMPWLALCHSLRDPVQPPALLFETTSPAFNLSGCNLVCAACLSFEPLGDAQSAGGRGDCQGIPLLLLLPVLLLQVVVLGARPEVPADMPEDYELLMKR